MENHYILAGRKGRTPKPVSLLEWAKWFETANRRVAWTELEGGVNISTVFLGLDHNFGGEGPPLLFETMIFSGSLDDYQERCSTWEEAEAMHERAIQAVKSAEGADLA